MRQHCESEVPWRLFKEMGKDRPGPCRRSGNKDGGGDAVHDTSTGRLWVDWLVRPIQLANEFAGALDQCLLRIGSSHHAVSSLLFVKRLTNDRRLTAQFVR